MSDTTTSQTSPDQTPTPPRRRHRVRNAIILATGVLAAFALIGSLAGHASPKAASAAAPSPAATQPAPMTTLPPAYQQPATQAPAAPASQAPAAPASQAPAAPASQAPAAPASQAPAAPATTAPATLRPAAPAGPTASQQQALDAAQNYLSDGQGFSRAGLIQQLTSQYGNGFSVADATWAVDNSGADWDAQAVTAAKNYMSDGQGFSRDSLIAQLDSPYGSQFTYAQAVYAAGQVGL